MVQNNEEENPFATWTVEQFEQHLSTFQTSPVPENPIVLNDRFEALTALENELHNRMEAIKTASNDLEQFPYLAAVAPLDDSQEFGKLRQLDAQAGAIRSAFSRPATSHMG